MVHQGFSRSHFEDIAPQISADALRVRGLKVAGPRGDGVDVEGAFVADKSISDAAQAVAKELARFTADAVQPGWQVEVRQLQVAADTAVAQGRNKEALDVYQRAGQRLIIAENNNEDTRLTRLCLENNQALLLKNLDRNEDAVKLLSRSIDTAVRAFPLEFRLISELYANLSRVHSAANQTSEAFEAQKSALEYRQRDPKDLEGHARFQFGFGLTAAQTGGHRQAAKAFERTLQLRDAHSAPRLALDARLCLAAALIELKELMAAEEHLLTCLKECSHVPNASSGFQAVVWKMIGAVRIRTNRYEDAKWAYQAALKVYQDNYLMDAIGMAEIHFNLGLLTFGPRSEPEFKLHMRRAADLIDEQGQLFKERDDHFRRAFSDRLHANPNALSQTDLNSLLMAPSRPETAS
jgi:tetratricopeptide (TPR) repeat protein